jgi:hypothetical protein
MTPLLPLVLDDVPPGLRAALEQEGVPVCDQRSRRAAGRFVLYDSRRKRPGVLLPEQKPIDVAAVGADFDEDPFAALVDTEAELCRWPLGADVVTERAARYDKRVIRRKLLDRLREQIQRAGGIWLRTAPYPFPYRSVFSFRIDYDQYDTDDFRATLEAVESHEGATSHFVNAGAYASAGGELGRLRGLDVGSHGYWHHTYRTRSENLRNIRHGIEVLRGGGLEPVGFVAPHGCFHTELASAIEAAGVPYSSEFGLVYDELPLFPLGTRTLQIPIHPVSLGSFLEAAGPEADAPALATTAERAAEYFDRVLRARYRSGEPALFYGHPTGRLGRFPHVLRDTLRTAADLGAMWNTTFSQIDRWWRARREISIRVLNEGSHFVVYVDRAPQGYRLGLEYRRGEHVASFPVNGPVLRFAPETLAYERRPMDGGVRPTVIPGVVGFRRRLRNWIDWETTTPIEEIPVDSVRNWAKRRLRAWLRSA